MLSFPIDETLTSAAFRLLDTYNDILPHSGKIKVVGLDLKTVRTISYTTKSPGCWNFTITLPHGHS